MRLPVLLLFLLLCVVAPARGGEGDGGWPFGEGGAFGGGEDLWNLGLLGAKASDPARPPTPEPGPGLRTGAALPAGGSDDGPAEALRLEVLFPGGPAQAAGLVPGDRIVGVGRRPFREGTLGPLAEALGKAEAKDGTLTLLVERAGAQRREPVEVTIPPGGKSMGRPESAAARARVVEAALGFLARRQDAGGGFPATLGGTNGVVVLASLAGLAWLAGGSDLRQGPYRENVARAADFVIANAGRRDGGFARPGATGAGGSMDQTNWGYAHAAIFLGELHARSPEAKVREALCTMGLELARRQEASGGWAHGPGGPNPLGYVELNIVTGFALAGMGLAAQAGCKVPEEVLARAEAYLVASGGGDGGVGYSDASGQAGQGNIGRTAGCWLGYQALDLGRSGWGRKMRKWIERHAGDVLGGHASLMQHVLLAGVAAHAIGGKAKGAWWDAVSRDLVLARAPDGSLQPRPWHESLSMGTNSDVTFGEVWTTAAWAVALACEPEEGSRPGLPYWMGLARAGAE